VTASNISTIARVGVDMYSRKALNDPDVRPSALTNRAAASARRRTRTVNMVALLVSPSLV
jgi:hypothetical protein